MSFTGEIFDYIYKNLISKKQVNKPLIVGINGIDTCGKTVFSKNLEKYLKDKGHEVQLTHIDDFHNPTEIRYSGKNQIENYYNRSFNVEFLVENILKPAKINGTLNDKFMLLNLETDKYDVEKQYRIDNNTFVILEGVFILREEIEPYLDYKIFIHVPFEQCKIRALERDVPVYGDDILKKYDTKYIPTQKYYLEKYPPEEYVDIIIENSDWNNPTIIFKR
ncbi:hypothetical protein [Brassicibacter mesophilus]|uniref:hypothetical protein n=1 Tax=Brassicibacter mesophilus TaxID=745119 RepID=UPI003D192C49